MSLFEISSVDGSFSHLIWNIQTLKLKKPFNTSAYKYFCHTHNCVIPALLTALLITFTAVWIVFSNWVSSPEAFGQFFCSAKKNLVSDIQSESKCCFLLLIFVSYFNEELSQRTNNATNRIKLYQLWKVHQLCIKMAFDSLRFRLSKSIWVDLTR